MPPTFEQRVTDAVHVRDLTGLAAGISVLTFTWNDPADHLVHCYTRTEDVQDVLDRHRQEPAFQVVTALAEDITHWDYLCSCGPDVLHRTPLETLPVTLCHHGSGPSGPLHTADERAGAGHRLDDVATEDLFAYDLCTGVLTSFASGKPVTRPLLLDAPAGWWDLTVLADLLHAHPWVIGLHPYGPPFSRNPASDPAAPTTAVGLGVVLRLPQEAYDRLAAAGQASPFHVERALLHPVHAFLATSVLGADPLGVVTALRSPSRPRRLGVAGEGAVASVPDPRSPRGTSPVVAEGRPTGPLDTPTPKVPAQVHPVVVPPLIAD